MGEFMKNDSSLFDGVFTYSNTSYNGRPVYTLDISHLVLFYQYNTTLGCQYWTVGAILGDPGGLLYSYTDVMSPENVQLWKYGSLDDKDVKFVCYEASTVVS